MRRPSIVVVVVTVLLVAVISASIYEVVHLKDERDGARTDLADARQSLTVETAKLNVMTESRDAYERSAANRTRSIRGLQKQVDWDKSHLLDCWTALVRIVPAERMTAIFGGPIGYLGKAARQGSGFSTYVRRCASDAVP